MELYDLRVNHLNNPMGYEMKRTVFSWKVRGAAGKTQTAARIVVRQGDAVAADTGAEESLSSLGAEVRFPLRPLTRYTWTVTVWTDAGETCVSPEQWFETPMDPGDWHADWITCDNAEPRHPIFETDFTPAKPVASARLMLCGLGLYEAFWNGARIGEEYFTPYCSDYDRWVQYQTYDVTQLLETAGVLSILLGNGWYKGRFGIASKPGGGFFSTEWKLLAQLRVVYADGQVETVGTGEDWRVRRSNITFSNLYDGEHRDDTLPELPVTSACLCPGPGGVVTPRLSTPVTVREERLPVALLTTPKGERVFDLGQEVTGIFRLRVRAPRGARIRVRTGEVLQGGCFYNENLRSAKSEYLYVSGGGETILEPRFTYYGYRYLTVEGGEEPVPEDLAALVLHSEVAPTGTLTTPHPLVSRLISNITWGMRGNFLDVPSDCPQRDERMGWTGDTQVFSATATYLANTYAFYRKYLRDLWEEQQTRDGRVPDVIPSCGLEGGACAWGDASCIIPWNLYIFYGDESILRDQYDSMRAWVEHIRKVDGDDHGWRRVFHYGDWLALDNPMGGVDQVFGGTEEGFIANVYYAASAGIVAKAAKVLGRTEDARRYADLSRAQFDAVREEYYSPTGRCCLRTQTALLLTLKYRLSVNPERIRNQLRRLFRESGGKLRTGFVGTPLLCCVLSEHGMDDLAYQLLLNEDYPGWLHEVKLGATTVWERWNSLDEAGNISSTGMNSLNHYAYGSVGEWLFRYAAGLSPIRDGAEVDAQGTEGRFIPGFRRAALRPRPNWALGALTARYDSPAGLWEVGWTMTDPTHLTVKVSVPFGCVGELTLPHAHQELYARKNPMFAHVQEGVCILAPGEYTVSYETPSLRNHWSLDTPVKELLEREEVLEALRPIFNPEDVPPQFRDSTLRELAEKYSFAPAGETLTRVAQALERL